MPSPLRSATTTSKGPEATGSVFMGWKVPLPLFRKTPTSLSFLFVTMMSSLPSAVEVGHFHVVGIAAGGELEVGLEGPVAVAQEHAHAGAFVIGGDDVRDAVAVEVGDGYRKRPCPVA